MSIRDRLLALAVVAVWGFNFVVIKWGVAGVPPFGLGALRFAAAFGCGVFLVRAPALPWRYLAAYGLTMGFGQFACLFWAIKAGMPASAASIVLQAQALFTLLLGALWLSEPVSARQWLSLVAGSAALALIALDGGKALPWLGLALTLAGAASWAMSNLVVRRAVRDGYRPDALALVVYASAVPILPFALMWALFEQGATDWPSVFSAKSVFAVAYLALVATLFGYGVWSRLLARHPASQVAPFSLLVPLFGVLFSVLLLGERLSPLQIAGGVLLIGALLAGSGTLRLPAFRRKAAG
ncbi:EamA family transporter [Crenobacter intestini]|uniref:O-acetylserine/cysteine exporter n=1 Tax=Crenobacter intestini TaxID=2563443 RepID=A0A4T0UTF8_9NEIS|nr:EamA family transporter [Crenobacter intestini]TIC82148.1 O-acetylserine/cysteine exporter [Crenobacter intestini]